MMLHLVWFISDQITNLLAHIVRSILWCSFFFSLAYSFGWIQRLLWLILEQTATALWNGTPVTIGSLEIDLIRGRIWATNVVIHTPKREEWQWESPLICRIGRVYVEHNWVSSFLAMLFRMACGQGQKQIIELYTVEISDIQGFIERKQHVFNFYLMDKLFDLPDPKTILEEEQQAKEQQQQEGSNSEAASSAMDGPKNRQNQMPQQQDNASEASTSFNVDEGRVEEPYSSIASNANANATLLQEGKEDLMEGEEDVMAHRQAQQLVDDMFNTVKSIGRAARRRGSLAGALVEQRAQLTSKLKQFKGSKNKSGAMQEGVKVIQRVGKAVAKKTKDMQTVMPKMPPRREPEEMTIFARVGRVIVEDARIFTRTSTSGPGKSAGASTTTTASSTADSTASSSIHIDSNTKQHQHQPDDRPKGDKSKGSAMSSQGLGSKWNKPIGISEIVLRSSELCPPNSLLDENGLPAIYQPVDKILDVIMKRALVGLAKSNTTRFLQTVRS